MRLKSSLFAFLFIAILAGCKDNSTEPTPSSGEIMPLKVGNTWNYKAYIIEPNSGLKVDAQRDYTSSVLKDTTIAGSIWFKIQNFVDVDGDEVIMQNRSSGLWAYDASNSDLIFKYPANVNETYQSEDVLIKVVSTDAKVESGGKTYTCYHYQLAEGLDPDIGEEGEFNFYLAPGVGMVKLAINGVIMEGITMNVSQELQSYTLK